MLTSLQKSYLRKEFQAYTGPPETTPLKTIGMVGACYFTQSESGLHSGDEEILEKSLKLLQSMGYTVATDFDTDVININENHGSKDYLAPDNKTRIDLSIICYIQRTLAPKKYDSHVSQYSPHELKSQQPWLESALRHASKAIITYGGYYSYGSREVTAEDFMEGGVYHYLKEEKLAVREPRLAEFLKKAYDYEPALELLVHKDIALENHIK
ncbi:MAG: hypothetical protein R3E13_01575 [Alphaproteobacteria bacterium]